MSSVNKAIILGRLGRDPEMRYSAGGQAVTQFSVATDRNYKKDDEWVSETEWHRVVAWGPLGERAAEFLHKGSLVYVEARIQTRSYEKDGVKKYSTELIAAVVTNLTPKPKDGDAESYDRTPVAAGAGARRPSSNDSEYDDLDSLPF